MTNTQAADSRYLQLVKLIAGGHITRAQVLASNALAAREITCQDYVRLVKLSEGRGI